MSTSAADTPYDKTAAVMQGVETLLAMPQWYVNFNLKNLLLNGSTSSGGSLQNVSLTFGSSNTWLNGVVAAMWCDVFVPGSTTKVKFLLQFSSGTMDYYDVTQFPPTKLSCDITGLQFGFDVNLGLATIDSGAAVPPEVAAGTAGLPPGSFTIQQLFMDFQNAALSQYDPSVTLFPASMPPAAAAAFPNYLNAYLLELASVGGHILGYGVTVNPTADIPATFPPTRLEFVTDQYQGGPNGSQLNPDLDTICYLMMTGDDPFPTNLTSWWGNFVVPTDTANGWYGTIAMSRELFLDQFLLPQLGPLVLQYWNLTDTNDSLAPNYTTATGTFTPTPLGGTWASGQLKSKSHKTNTWSNDDVEYTFSFSANLQLVPGTNQVIINRNLDFTIDFTHWYGLDGHAASSEFSISYNVPLTITINLLGVADGQLQVSATSKTRDPDPGIVYGDPYGWDIVGTSGSYSIWSSVSDTLDTTINTAVGAALPAGLLPGIESVIANKLNLHPFVFPGGAQLFMANSTFTDAGDLLLGLQYKQ